VGGRDEKCCYRGVKASEITLQSCALRRVGVLLDFVDGMGRPAWIKIIGFTRSFGCHLPLSLSDNYC